MLLLTLLIFVNTKIAYSGILYPRESETREVISLDGLWTFALTKNSTQGLAEQWYSKQLSSLDNVTIETMPVPASYNDIGVSVTLRDHFGPVWYQREFFVPSTWSDRLIWIRFGSVCYSAQVWINGQAAVNHSIGHLPFQAEISSFLSYNSSNSITVLVDNTLTNVTIPQGSWTELESGRIKQTYTYDFFNYAGIDRPVFLYTTSKTYIDDITINTNIDGTTGMVNYQISVAGPDEGLIIVTLKDRNGKAVAADLVANGTLTVTDAKFWWPYLMNPDPGYLYNLQATITGKSGDLLDSYILPVGIRTITWTNTSLLINNQPVYLRGFGRHEDSDITGKGLDPSLILRDYNLIRWIGANSYRTSHYPYAEEIMDLADQLGIMIIDESPAVNTENFSEELLEHHKRSITELIQRDKNRPGVIIWSAANEPRTQYAESEDYYRALLLFLGARAHLMATCSNYTGFLSASLNTAVSYKQTEVIAHIKSLDQSRPVTVVNNQRVDIDHSAQFIDIVSFNRYQSWYESSGDLDIIVDNIVDEARAWHKAHNVPVLITEYGGDTQEGLHLLPSYIWSEEFQSDLLSRHFAAFDKVRAEGFFIGEMIWNFADFKTAERIRRVGGNKKGIFTRNRQPKASAHLVRKRYWNLAQNLDKADLPADLNQYVFKRMRDEL